MSLCQFSKNEKVYKDSARILAESGITSVLDAALRDYEIVKFADFASIIDLTYRLHIAFYSDYDEFRTISSNEINIDQIITTIKDLQENYNDIPNFHLTTGKIFVDGVLEGDPLSTPPMLPNAASLSDYLQPVCHAQVIHPDDKPRLSDIEIFFAFTYSWIEPFSDYLMTVSPFFDRIFSEEDLYHQKNYYYKNSYPVKSVQDAGGILVAGSDAPVETRDPRPF